MYVPLPRFLLRAPLLPIASLSRAERALAAHPLGAAAIAIASPTLAAARPGPARRRAVARYARRAAFRATPSGLWAGVCVGELGPRTEVATGEPAPFLAPSWARVDALARALLDDPEVRERVRLRSAPSVWRDGPHVRRIGFGDPEDAARTVEADAHLVAILTATRSWTPWPTVRARAENGADEGDVDDLLLACVDDGLLQTELAPPLIGPPPALHLRDRLTAIGRTEEARALEAASAPLAEGDLPRGRAAFSALPGQASRDVHAVLVHRPRRPPRLERAAVARAARLVPLLVRLQEALAPPAAERFTSSTLAGALDAATEIFGAGAFELGTLAAGDYGVELERDDDPPAPAAPPPPLIALLVDAVATAVAGKQAQATLDLEALEAALADLAETPLPPTVELFLAPIPRPRNAPAGTGWLLGLHAPAGASWGRFVHALGAPLAGACGEIVAAERRVRPDEERVDVAFAPDADLADLASHPSIRGRAVALSRWSGAGTDLTVPDLALEADPAAPSGLVLRESDDRGAQAVVPSPLARVRSATAPPGAARLLVGWSLQRQHAPWAFVPGPLAHLAFLPRLVLEGFVIAPASWRLPAALRRGSRPAALARWRRAAGVPRHVQVGVGDELYPVDLEAGDAAADLVDHARVFEIWPPLAAIVDRDGRRLEAIVALIDEAPPPLAVTRLERIPPPRRAPPLDGWRTFKLFGAAARQDDLLLDTVVPAVGEGRRTNELDAWFFLRYVDGPGERPHLRLRVRAPDGDPARFERRLRAALAPARAAGVCAALETSDYFPERGRFAAGELDAVHALFQSDSEAVAALLAIPELDRLAALPLLFDALARGLGLDLPARHALAAARRQAADAWTGLDAIGRRQTDAAFRQHARPLRAALAETAAEGAGPRPDPTRPILARHEAAVAKAARDSTEPARARWAPTLLHLDAVRLLGADPDAERIGYTFWERTLEGLRKTR